MPPDSLSNTGPQKSTLTVDQVQFLPSKDQMTRMRTEFIDLVSRVVVFHLDGLSHFMNSVSWLMDHEHQEEASTKSVRLPLGLLQCNESTIQGMMEIVRTVNRLYVPYVDGKSVVRVQFTGDQKTAERFRSTVSSVLSEETEYDRIHIVKTFIALCPLLI